jgi:hypothetical protein
VLGESATIWLGYAVFGRLFFHFHSHWVWS